MIINKLSGISNPLSLERLMPGTTFLRKTRREELTGTKKTKGKNLANRSRVLVVLRVSLIFPPSEAPTIRP